MACNQPSEAIDKHGNETAAYKRQPQKTWRDLPTGFTNGSEIAYDMRDWDLVLKKSVVFTGKPERKISRPSRRAAMGTNLDFKNNSVSRLDSNRVILYMFNRRHKAFVRDTVARLQQIPEHIPLENMSRDNQLAYWLNLRNAALLQEIGDIYPVSNMKKHLNGPRSILTKPVVTVLGVTLTIADIEDYISTTFQDPLVFYGFAYGVIGGPSFRTHAFRGETVWQALRLNAIEFVNSLRGIRDAASETARVSIFYAQHPALFNLKSADFVYHLRDYAKGNLAAELEQVSAVTADYADWHIADLVNGNENSSLTQIRAKSQLSAHAGSLLREIEVKNRRMARGAIGVVTLEEYKRTNAKSKPEIKEETDEDDEVVINDNNGPE